MVGCHLLKAVEGWTDQAPKLYVWIPGPGPGHAAILAGFFGLAQMTGRLVPDAHLAALAIEHGLTLCSPDGDFAKFPGLKWLNPLAA